MKSALIGGAALGVASALPFVNILNVCCCAWAIIGGVLASYMYIKGSPTPVKLGEGALLGLIAGVIGAVIYVILGVPLSLAMGNTMASMMADLIARSNPEQAEQIRIQMAQGASVGGAIGGALVGGICLIVFATLGGLIGTAILEKRKGDGPGTMPPPPAYGGGAQPGGGGYGSYGSNQ
jgi:hypothetical protein